MLTQIGFLPILTSDYLLHDSATTLLCGADRMQTSGTGIVTPEGTPFFCDGATGTGHAAVEVPVETCWPQNGQSW